MYFFYKISHYANLFFYFILYFPSHIKRHFSLVLRIDFKCVDLLREKCTNKSSNTQKSESMPKDKFTFSFQQRTNLRLSGRYSKRIRQYLAKVTKLINGYNRCKYSHRYKRCNIQFLVGFFHFSEIILFKYYKLIVHIFFR